MKFKSSNQRKAVMAKLKAYTIIGRDWKDDFDLSQIQRLNRAVIKHKKNVKVLNVRGDDIGNDGNYIAAVPKKMTRKMLEEEISGD